MAHRNGRASKEHAEMKKSGFFPLCLHEGLLGTKKDIEKGRMSYKTIDIL